LAGFGGRVVVAFDVNNIANDCYRHNYGSDLVQQVAFYK
jgi:hypothetical protein